MYIVVYKCLLQFVYRLSSIIRAFDSNKVVIPLYRSDELEGNLKFIYDELIEQMPNAKIHFVFGENKMNLKLFKEIVSFSNAKYMIIDDYYLPVYLLRLNSNLKVVQLWHAAGAFKKFGHSTIGTKFGPNSDYMKLVPIHSSYTHVYVSSGKVIHYYAEAFNMSADRIFPIGIPRIDLFSHKEKCKIVSDEIFNEFPDLQSDNKVNILLAPTYRAEGAQGESNYDVVDSIIEIAAMLDNNKRIIFKAHPYMDKSAIKRMDKCDNILVASNYSINEWMLIADAFITDYSSSILEFALLQRPLAHFVPDLEEYEHNRGFYQELKMISDGIILQNSVQLVEWINSRSHNEFFDTSRMIEYNFDNTENVSRKIVSHFL